MTARTRQAAPGLLALVVLLVAAAALWSEARDAEARLEAVRGAERDQTVIADRIAFHLGPDLDLPERQRALREETAFAAPLAAEAREANAASRAELERLLGARP